MHTYNSRTSRHRSITAISGVEEILLIPDDQHQAGGANTATLQNRPKQKNYKISQL
jgi:hypothetical protein